MQRFADEFDKFNPERTPVADDEDLSDEPYDKNKQEIPKNEIAYNKKVEQYQMNPITLTETSVGLEEIFEARKTAAEKGE